MLRAIRSIASHHEPYSQLSWKCHRARSKQSRLWGCRQQIRSSIEARFRLREDITALALVQHGDIEQPSLQRYK
jgi:hypothetical protein